MSNEPLTGRVAWYCSVAAISMFIASICAIELKPNEVVEHETTKLHALVPEKFGNWVAAADSTQQVSLVATDENGLDPMQAVYNDSLIRTYVGPNGKKMMLAIAYDYVQREEDRVHRPEICYLAQGFRIVYDRATQFNLNDRAQPIDGRQMLTVSGGRWEAVSFWIRTGNSFTQNPWKSRIYIIKEGLAGRLHDGLLLRVSEIVKGPAEAEQSFLRQREFLNEFASGLSPQAATVVADLSNHDYGSN